jgi:hypothetical protein
MTRLIGRIPTRQVVPGRPGAQHPQHAVQHRAAVLPRSATAVGPATRTKKRFEYLPLRVSEVHVVEYDATSNFVHKPTFGFMR